METSAGFFCKYLSANFEETTILQHMNFEETVQNGDSNFEETDKNRDYNLEETAFSDKIGVNAGEKIKSH